MKMGATWEASAVRKFLNQLAYGAIVGVIFAAGFLYLARPVLRLSDGLTLFTASIGLIYVLLGLCVGIGASMPKAGAHFLNVEDADELKEQRSMLVFSAFSCCFAGLLLFVLAFGPLAAGGAVGSSMLAWAPAFCFAGAIVTGKLCADRCDELMRQLCAEAGGVTLFIGLLFLGGWSALAHLGLVVWIKPLGFLPGFALLYLLASFWVVGRRGMLKPR